VAFYSEAIRQDKQGFFDRIRPLLRPLRSYIKHRLITAYANWEIRTPLYTSTDLLDEVILKAYENFARKPPDLNLEQWFYRLANEVVRNYIRERKEAADRPSVETLQTKELAPLEELPQLTADVEGEPWLTEDLDDAEWDVLDFAPPVYQGLEPPKLDPKGRRKELKKIVRVLGRLSEADRVVVELFFVEGFSNEETAKIANVTPNDVQRIVEKVKQKVASVSAAENRQMV
jgi:RNA polymerase sigma factor (sigma-70 family)